jgi:hypothetical protein
MVPKMFPLLHDEQNLFIFLNKMSAKHFETHKHRKLFLVYSVIPILSHYPLKIFFMFMMALQHTS